jgi:hypothetical protein
LEKSKSRNGLNPGILKNKSNWKNWLILGIWKTRLKELGGSRGCLTKPDSKNQAVPGGTWNNLAQRTIEFQVFSIPSKSHCLSRIAGSLTLSSLVGAKGG